MSSTTTRSGSASGKETEASLQLADGSVWPCRPGSVIGRQGDVASGVLAGERTLSRRHLRLDHDGERWWLARFPDALNHTWVDGTELAPGDRRPLFGAHLVQVAEMQFRILTGSPRSRGGGEALPFSEVLRDAPVSLVVLDESLRCRWITNRAADRLGLGPEKQAEGDFTEQLVPEARTRFRRELAALTLDSGCAMVEVPMATGPEPPVRLRFCYRFPYFIGSEAGDEARGEGTGAVEEDQGEQMAEQLRFLALLSRSAAFQQGDVAGALAQVTVGGGGALRAVRVRIWLADENGDGFACRASHGPDGSDGTSRRIRSGYCPAFFDCLAAPPHLGVAAKQSVEFAILEEIGFVGPGTDLLLVAGIRIGEQVHGLIAFERSGGRMEWADSERHFARSLADLCLVVIQAAEREGTLRALREKERLVGEGIANARRYVTRLLPEPMEAPDIDAEWQFEPSEDLGGDLLGYHWLDPDHLAMYVVDVVGHGTGAALLSVSVMNALRSHLLPAGDFRSPAAVLEALNRAFLMEEQDMLTCTMWYGVYDRVNRTLVYASAGHPPALLLREPETEEEADHLELGGDGLLIGGMEDATYENGTVFLGERSAKLFVFSDGVFEIPIGEERTWSFGEFTAAVRFTRTMESGETRYLLERARGLCAQPVLPDDYAMLRLTFRTRSQPR